MNKYLKNFYDLYSLDDSTVYKAILFKKDWLFQPFYIPYTFEKKVVNGKDIYPSLYALMDQSVLFKKLKNVDELFDEHEDKKEKILKAFNDNYSYMIMYKTLTSFIEEGTFLVEFDFYKMDEKAYKELVANVYPCISNVEELDLFYDENRIEDLLKYAMHGEDNKWVIILSNSLLLDGKYYMPYMKTIYYNLDKINEEQLEGLKEIAEKMDIEIKEYN